MAEEPEPRPAITKVWAKNFRSIEYAELELDPLTVLVGPNASGKSNLLDILGFLSDASRDGLETAIARRGGIDSIKRGSDKRRTPRLEMGFQSAVERGILSYCFTLSGNRTMNPCVEREFARIERLEPKPSFDEVGFTRGSLTNSGLSRKLESAISMELEPLMGDGALHLLPGLTLANGLPLMVLASETTKPDLYDSLLETAKQFTDIQMYHIFPNSLREPQKVADSHPLTANADNLASALHGMIKKNNRFLPDLKHALNYAVPGITDIRVSRAGSFQVVELKHDNGRNGRGTWFDLSYESDGTIRLLAMLTALFQEPSLPLIGLEEPELAIHPGAMAVLAENMVEASLRGQVVVATHSPDLIDRMPVESIRAVSAESGSTKVGRVAAHQLKSVREGLFSAGEIHSMMGLCPEDQGA